MFLVKSFKTISKTMTLSQVNATRIARRVVDRSFKLRDRYLAELGKLDAPQRWVVVQEVSKLVEEFAEKVTNAAEVQKEIIDSRAKNQR